MGAALPLLLLSASPASAPPPAASPPLATSPKDVVASATANFAAVGTLGFAWRGARALASSQSLKTASAMGLQAAQRWGRVSAAFAGGRALGQVIFKTDNAYCAAISASLGGIAAASSAAEVPSSVASFLCFSLLLENMAPKLATEPEPSYESRKDIRQDRRVSKSDQAKAKNIFGEPAGAGLRPGGWLDKKVSQWNNELGHG